MLALQVQRLEQYPALRTKFRSSLNEKELQLARVEALLDNLGENRSAFKDAVMRAAAGIAGLASATADDEVIKNSFGTLAHSKMAAAAYRNLDSIRRSVRRDPRHIAAPSAKLERGKRARQLHRGEPAADWYPVPTVAQRGTASEPLIYFSIRHDEIVVLRTAVCRRLRNDNTSAAPSPVAVVRGTTSHEPRIRSCTGFGGVMYT